MVSAAGTGIVRFPRPTSAVVIDSRSAVTPIATTGDALARIGPAGPTMNRAGEVAFRADTRAGESGVFVARRGAVVRVADTTEVAAFQGLPLINDRGTVAYRADLRDGGHGIYVGPGGALGRVETGERFCELGRFPSLNHADVVAFAARVTGGGAGVFTLERGRVTPVIDTSAGFESFRGALINDAGTVFFYGTPSGGELGVYAAADPRRAIVAFGEALFGSTVVDFALNPVSVNARDQLAIRVRLADGRQLIVRADPA